jgi:phenylacetate-CoA ligase
MTVLVEADETIFFDEVKKQNSLIDLIKKRLATELGISVNVKLVEKKTLERFEGKANRVVDNRKI